MDDAALSFDRAADSRETPISKPGEQGPGGANGWTRVSIARIEDLSDAVYGAGLEAMQMSRGRVTGSLAFAEHDGILFSTGYIGGRVSLTGPLSETMITLGLGLHLAAGTAR